MNSKADDDTLISLFTRKAKSPKTASTARVENRVVDPPKTNLKASFLKKHWVYLAILTGLVFIVYVNTLDNGLVSDDNGLLLDKNNLTTFKYIFADPLSFFWSLVHAPIYAIFGINPLVLRLLNILMHLGNTFLVFIILSLLANPVLAFFSASLFAVHPVMTEAVTWISGGPYSWYAFFFLLSFLLYIKSSSRRDPILTYGLSLVVFVVGLLTSNRVMQLFPIFYVYEFVFGQTTGGLRKNWLKLVPFTVISLVWGLIYYIQIGGRQEVLQSQFYLEKGIDNPLIQIPFAITNYLILIFFPVRYTFDHSDLTFTSFQLLLFWLVFLVFVGVWVYTFFKKRFLFFWLSFFIISLLITLTPFRIAWIVAERYVYLGALGLFVCVAYFFEKFFKKNIIFIIFIIIITIISLRAIIRNNDWQAEKTLWLATVASTPASPKPHNNIGVIYSRENNLDLAEKELTTAITLKPNYGDAYNNLGEVYFKQKKFDQAVVQFQKAVAINPNLYLSYEYLAAIAFEAGKPDLSLQFLTSALKAKNNDPDIYINLAIVYNKLDQKEKAQAALTSALKLEPTNQKAQSMLQTLSK